MVAPDLTRLGIAALIPELQSRALSASAVADACLARIEQREPSVGAWQVLDRDAVCRAAEELDRGPLRGVLHGIPVGIKDIIDVAGLPTGCGSAVYADRIAARDAACVARLRAGGALIMGKTVTTEFSYFRPGKTANPHHVGHTPGGSSSGSAAAVADMMVPAALGAQTAGSLTRPAAYCGVIGFKATRDSIPLEGVEPLAHSFDSLGWLVRDVEDAEVLRAVLTGDTYRPLDVLSRAPRLAICETNEWSHADAHARETLHQAAALLQAAGAQVTVLTLPDEFSGLVDCHISIMSYEAARALGNIIDTHSDAVSPQLHALVETGRHVSDADYASAQERTRVATRKLESFFDNVDAIVAPSAPGDA
ncbi:MAG: amidase, partial [Pseudolabrys sp.]